MHNALVDTGIWLAMFNPRDQYHNQIGAISDRLEMFDLVLPWPTLYETLRSKFAKNRRALQGFEEYLKHSNISYLDDKAYCEKALKLCFSSSLKASRPLSMVDCLIRLLLEDVDVKVNYLATFNIKDFGDACRKRQIEIIM